MSIMVSWRNKTSPLAGLFDALVWTFKERFVLGRMKDLIEGEYVVPKLKELNEPHATVTIIYGNKDFLDVRVWPWTDYTTALVPDSDYNLDSVKSDINKIYFFRMFKC